VPELIGIVEGISLSNLSLSDSQQFIFVWLKVQAQGIEPKSYLSVTARLKDSN
jgi:hypothetical protein